MTEQDDMAMSMQELVMWANERPPCGPVMGCHVAGGKFIRKPNIQISKNWWGWLVPIPNVPNLIGFHQIWLDITTPPDLTISTKGSANLTESTKVSAKAIHYIYNVVTICQKWEAHRFDPGISPITSAFAMSANRLGWGVTW
jgi:hypothetical protein